jgi:hypothetical protein
MPTIVVEKRLSPGVSILKFLVIMSTRFFLGMPMNGKRKDNSTFLKGATKGKPGHRLTKWQRKAWIIRGLIRGAVFWPIAGLMIGLIIDRGIALLALALASPFLAYLGFRRGRLVFFQPFTSLDAVTGRKTQHWKLRYKYAQLFRRKIEPGLLTKKNRIDETLPAEVQKALLAEINGNQFKGKTPATKVRRVTGKDIKKLAGG